MRTKFLLTTLFLAMLTRVSMAARWSVSTSGSLLQISYGTPQNSPQYAVLDLSSGYFRLNTGPASGWGTSIDLMPCYWSGGVLYQGYPVTVYWRESGPALLLVVRGTSNNYRIQVNLTILPPTASSISVGVAASITGSMPLDNRPGEAFKPMFLSSMHDTANSWDSKSVFVGSTTYNYPSGGWIIGPSPVVTGTKFGLLGGTSNWKTNAPTMTILYGGPVQVAGWLTTDTNPNDDNVGFWPATTAPPTHWGYTIVATQGPGP